MHAAAACAVLNGDGGGRVGPTTVESNATVARASVQPPPPPPAPPRSPLHPAIFSPFVFASASLLLGAALAMRVLADRGSLSVGAPAGRTVCSA